MLKKIFNKENRETVFLTFYFSVSPISKLLEKIWIPRPATYIVFLFACAVYLANRYHLTKIKKDVLAALLILTPILIFAMVFHHNDFNGANEMYAMIIIFYPAYFIMRVADTDKLIKALHYSAYIGLAIYLPNAFLVENIRDQYITYAYDILIPLGIVVYYAMTDKRWYDIIISIVGTILLAVFGSRGALIALALYYIYLNFSKKDIKRIIIITVLLTIVLFAYWNLGAILTWLKRFGISSYALTRISNGDAFTSIARFRLYDYIVTTLLPNNYLGYGTIGNRALMPVILNHEIRYPHQLFFELLIDYGLIVGSIISISIICVTVYMLIKSKREYRYLTALYCVLSLFPLMLSGTFYAVGTVPYIFAIFVKFREERENSKIAERKI